MAAQGQLKRTNVSFSLVLIVALLLSSFDWIIPRLRMPLDFYGMLHISLPLAFGWAIVFGFALAQFRLRSLWLLLTAPLALYWPLWLLINGLPSCYYAGNCV